MSAQNTDNYSALFYMFTCLIYSKVNYKYFKNSEGDKKGEYAIQSIFRGTKDLGKLIGKKEIHEEGCI